ncbi:MAG: sigma-54 dependent transcriptional regulator [Planctomycetota bacterium]
MSHVLIVDDEASICWGFRELLTDEGHEVTIAPSAEDALDAVAQRAPDAVLLDVRLPGMDGLSAMSELRARIGSAPVIVMTAFGDLDVAVRAVEGGAFEYLPKPFELEEVLSVLRRALSGSMGRTDPDVDDLESSESGLLIGTSLAMRQVFKEIALVAGSEVPVLITGESGTGKELVARAIHVNSARKSGPFLPVHLASLSPGVVESELFGHCQGAFTGAVRDRKGMFELASQGTLFLDEIAEATPALQVKLLRALESREITPVGDSRTVRTGARVLAATNRPIHERIRSGDFREDLYFRLGVFHIEIPPLRERQEDIPLLANHFLARRRGELFFSDDAMRELRSRSWPGNIRELKNAVERAAILARRGPILVEHLPSRTSSMETSPELDLRRSVQAWTERAVVSERQWLERGDFQERFLDATEGPFLAAVLKHCHANLSQAARWLGLHRATLRQRLRRHRLRDTGDVQGSHLD